MKFNDEASFYIILLSDSEYLPLPSAFAKKYLEKGDNKKQTIVLKTQSGVEWRVRYIRIEDRYYFKGGWLKFMNKNRLQFGDFLVFWLRSFDPKPVFEVIIYSPNGCLKNTPNSSDDTCLDNKKKPSGDSDSLENVEGSVKLSRVVRKCYRYRMPLTRCFVKAAGIDDYGPLRLENSDGKMWDANLEMSGQDQSLFIGTGWLDFVKDNNVEVGDRCVITHVQDNLFHVHVSKKRGRPKGCVKHSSDDAASGNKKKPSIEEATSDSVLVENVKGSVALSRVVRKCYIPRMPLTFDFVNAAGIDDYGLLRLENNDGKMWDAKLGKSGQRQTPVIGWLDFVNDNKVKVGDSCVFTYVQDNLLRVHVMKKRGRPYGSKSKVG
ncbi:putative transcription factor B3-Domain family [Helianthus annuus]|nr:putative transcription factor B3-Domain family [Helianthus annuus]